jgi:hypothetical protein
MIRLCHLRWGGADLSCAAWELGPEEIVKQPHVPLTRQGFPTAAALAALVDVLLLEIPAAPFQEAFFYHRNPLKNALDLSRTYRLWDQQRRLQRLVDSTDRPLVVFDFQDSCAIPARFLPFIRRSVAYHKRELPRLPVNAFLHTETFAIEPWRNRGRYAAEVAKLRPLSFGALCPVLPPAPNGPRDIDVLWGGTVENSPVRQHGVRLLRELKAEQPELNIVLLEESVSKEAFQALLARARLAFCPDGNGWQCYRTFEAAQLGAVPLLTHPPIWLDEPLRDSEHAFYYDPYGDDLKRVIRRVLKDSSRFDDMSSATRTFVRRHHGEAAVYQRHIQASAIPAPMPSPP